MKILIADKFDASLPGRLAAFGEVTDDRSQLPNCEVALIRSKTRADRAFLDEGKALKLVIRGGVGLDNVDAAYAKEKGVQIKATPEASSIAVAELAFALMLAAPNHLVQAHQGMARGEWLKDSLKRTELYGKTLALLGMGRIATEVALRAKAFGMTVIAHRKSGEPSPHAQVYPRLEDVLPVADYVSLHTPLTPETQGMLGANALALVKHGVIVVNTGRSACVDSVAMLEALKSGQVACYATDVWQSDPPPPDDPLLSAPNLLMTPHLGASSKENLSRIGDQVVRILETYRAANPVHA